MTEINTRDLTRHLQSKSATPQKALAFVREESIGVATAGIAQAANAAPLIASIRGSSH